MDLLIGMFILHSGQSGVERGVHRGARMLGYPVAGFCTPTRRDELGRLPDDVAVALIPCLASGPRAALEANLAIASAVVVVVPVRRDVASATGMAAVMRGARARGIPCEVADPQTSPEKLHAWLAGVPPTSGSVRVLFTGPRATRWPEGDRVGWRLVTGILAETTPLDQLTIPASRRAESR